VTTAVVQSGFLPEIDEIVSGGCRGIDLAGELFAEEYRIPVKRFDPDWANEGKAAGPIRNGKMAEYGDGLVLIHNHSRGSLDMLRKAKDQQKLRPFRIYEYIVK
jgi:hypothetical protein